ncbi:TetR/AcrR family transcriptional regulator [Amaricoccus macauensis]|uniref:TetR/AcrR family transcriptional regulator n=1 Tax=Amaricoccus macauensis TaxID=57001 RepID=UPI003C7D88C1
MSTIRLAGTSKPQTTSKSEATRRRLVEAARKLFTEQGFEKTSVTQIAKAAGVTHSLINAYFGGKAGLIYAVLHDFNQAQIDEINETVKLEGSTLERIRMVLHNWARHNLSDRQLNSIMQAYSWQWPMETEMQNRAQVRDALRPIIETLQLGIESGELREDLNIDDTLYIILAIYKEGMRQAIFDDVTPEEAEKRVLNRIGLLMDGLRRR